MQAILALNLGTFLYPTLPHPTHLCTIYSTSLYSPTVQIHITYIHPPIYIYICIHESLFPPYTAIRTTSASRPDPLPGISACARPSPSVACLFGRKSTRPPAHLTVSNQQIHRSVSLRRISVQLSAALSGSRGQSSACV